MEQGVWCCISHMGSVLLFERHMECGVFMRGKGCVVLCERHRDCIYERQRECDVICVAPGVCCYISGMGSVLL